MITVDEVAFHIRQVARAAGLPMLVDGDTGYGEALNVMHMVRVFEEAGAGAVHLEDQLLPKKCGHLNDKKLADARDMAAKVAAARKARRHLYPYRPHRCRGVGGHGRRGGPGEDVPRRRRRRDLPRGADDAGDVRRVRKAHAGVKLLANMTEFGRTPFLTAKEFEELGYSMVIWPVSHLRVANRAMEELYASIRENGGTQKLLDRMQTRAQLYETIGYHEYEALDASLVKTVVPEGMPQG
jgi:methylisocitrate lyase